MIVPRIETNAVKLHTIILKFVFPSAANFRQEAYEMNRKHDGMPNNMMHKEANAGIAMKNGNYYWVEILES